MVYLITKWHFLYFRANIVNDLVNELDACHREAKKQQSVVEIRAQQREFFVLESALGAFWTVGVTLFVASIMALPLYTNQKLPFHAIFPFEWHDPDKHPIAFALVYVWQCFALINNMYSVLAFDLLSTHIFTQLAGNMKVLSIELRSLAKLNPRDIQYFHAELRRLFKFHQRILRLVDLTNDIFYVPMIMQMVVSFFLISLSTFISLVARHNPSVASRFILFMVLSFLHLSYWCITGNMVNDHSDTVAEAAYDAYEWSPHVPHIQRDIAFMIKRAQKPISMGANPFPPLNRTSYMAILKQCYSILTLMLESLD
ncbi:hypothetical protein KR093_004830 [Drosophila rubida]|uniref:Odorant receptor n=1 Tax=Drosophila rubida TaxID=30044 RepID=A0AAD4JY06_9MUSC|nr:hypothetical protein KR093_004830 [Drosophila rubida]